MLAHTGKMLHYLLFCGDPELTVNSSTIFSDIFFLKLEGLALLCGLGGASLYTLLQGGPGTSGAPDNLSTFASLLIGTGVLCLLPVLHVLLKTHPADYHECLIIHDAVIARISGAVSRDHPESRFFIGLYGIRISSQVLEGKIILHIKGKPVEGKFRVLAKTWG